MSFQFILPGSLLATTSVFSMAKKAFQSVTEFGRAYLPKEKPLLWTYQVAMPSCPTIWQEREATAYLNISMKINTTNQTEPEFENGVKHQIWFRLCEIRERSLLLNQDN